MNNNYKFSNTQYNYFLIIIILMINNLSLAGQTLTLIRPNGGENWQTETSQTINWELTGEPQNLILELSTDDGTYWSYVAFIPAEDTSGKTTYFPYYPSDNALMRISLYDNPSIKDDSDGSFTISENPVYFYSLYHGLQLYQNIEFEISWYCNFTNADIEFSPDNGESWSTVASNIEGQYYVWNTPDIQSDECIIKIIDATDTTVFGVSPTFSIIDQPSATILSPNGGETWNYGETANVSWTGANLPYYLNIEYSEDGGNNWTYFSYAYSEPSGGSTDVYVPYISTENAKLRLVDPNFNLVLDESDEVFTLYVPPVIVYNPYEGQEFYIKDVSYVSWLATGVDLLNIELSTDNGSTWIMIDQNIDANNSWYTWNIEGVPSENCLIKVSDASDPATFGLTGKFTLLATPVITLTNPVGGEIWNTSTAKTITWTYDNPNAYYAYIEFSPDNGQSWNYVGYGYMEGNQGSFDWVTPAITSEQCVIRIRDGYLNFVSDTSNIFTIRTFPETPICLVTVDSATNSNIVVWEKPQDDLVSNFIVYKETDISDVYEAIGTVEYDSLSMFVDPNSNPLVKSYRYKLGFADSKGNEYPLSSYHQTIHLSINQGVGNSWNLIWNDYLGINVPSYTIYRSNNGSEYSKIATISSSFNSYTDIDAPAGTLHYYVEVINENGCNLTLRETSFNNSISNIVTNNFLSVDDNEMMNVSVYPNPASGTVKMTLRDNKEYRIQLVDLTGQVIFGEEKTGGKYFSEMKIDVSQFKNGLYLIRISDGSHQIAKKLVIQN